MSVTTKSPSPFNPAQPVYLNEAKEPRLLDNPGPLYLRSSAMRPFDGATYNRVWSPPCGCAPVLQMSEAGTLAAILGDDPGSIPWRGRRNARLQFCDVSWGRRNACG
jgi:hypothetical protein